MLISADDKYNTYSAVNTNKLGSRMLQGDVFYNNRDCLTIETMNKSRNRYFNRGSTLFDNPIIKSRSSENSLKTNFNFEKVDVFQNRMYETNPLSKFCNPRNKIWGMKNIETVEKMIKEPVYRNINLQDKSITSKSGSSNLFKDEKSDKEKTITPFNLLGNERWSNNNVEILKKLYPMLTENMCKDLYNSLCIFHEIDDNFLDFYLVVDFKLGKDILMNKNLKKRFINLMRAIRSGTIPKEMNYLYENHVNILTNFQVVKDCDKIIFKDLSYKEKTIMRRNSQFIGFIINKILSNFDSNMKSINKKTIETEL